MIKPEVPEDDGRILEFHDIFGNFIFLFILVTNRKVKQNKSPNLRRVSQQNSTPWLSKTESAQSLFTNKLKFQRREMTCLLSTVRFRKPNIDGAQFEFETQAGLGQNFDQSELSAAIRTRHLLNKLGIFLSWLSVFSVVVCYCKSNLFVGWTTAKRRMWWIVRKS